MRAEAVVEVEQRGGRSVCARLRSEPPITLRRTGDGVVHQVGSGAGPIGGDELVLRVRVGPGASLTLRTVAAAIVLPGPTGAPSHVLLDADVADGGHLAVLPEPQVIAAGADHEVRTRVRLGVGATLTWRDESVFGRHGEVGGSLLHRLRVDRGEVPLVRTDVAAGPRWPDSPGPAGLDGARCLGTLLVVGDPNREPVGDVRQEGPTSPTGSGSADGVRAGAMELAPGITLVTALADTAGAVRRGLDRPMLART